MKNKGYFGGRTAPDKKTYKKIIIITVIVLAALIPAIAALINYSINSKAPDSTSADLMKVSLYDGDTLLYEEEEVPDKAAASTLVSIFDSILKNKTEALNSPNLSERSYLIAVISTKNETNEYKCYFSEDDESSYLLDSSDNLFHISALDSHSFMTSDYAETLYLNATPPKLLTTAGDVVTPIAVDWKYVNSSDTVKIARKVETAEPELMYDMAGALGISFDTVPDQCTVKLYKSGIIIFSGSYTQLPEIKVEPGTTLQLKVEAIWSERADHNRFGSVSYDFKVLLRDRSEFILNKTELTTGDFLTVACTNVLDTSKVSFEAEPDIGFNPIFFKDGDIVRSLIPFDESLPEGTYSLTFSYGATHETVEIKLTKHPGASTSHNVADQLSDKFTALVSSASQNELTQIMQNIDPSHVNYIFFRNGFDDYSSLKYIKAYKYGDVFTTANAEISHSVQGELWAMPSEGASVTALSGGYVAKVGNCEYLGTFLVIEHGMGLRTVYGHLDDIKVNEGDYVSLGELIGHTGRLSEVSPGGVFVQCYIFDTAIDPSVIMGKKIDLYTLPKETEAEKKQ